MTFDDLAGGWKHTDQLVIIQISQQGCNQLSQAICPILKSRLSVECQLLAGDVVVRLD